MTVFSGRTVIATCANPARNVSFRYFRNGKIFALGTTMWTLDQELTPENAESSTFGCLGNMPAMPMMRTTGGAVPMPTFHNLLIRLWLQESPLPVK